jgi:hypothetical protein
MAKRRPVREGWTPFSEEEEKGKEQEDEYWKDNNQGESIW